MGRGSKGVQYTVGGRGRKRKKKGFKRSLFEDFLTGKRYLF